MTRFDSFVERRDRAATVLDSLAELSSEMTDARHVEQLELAAARARDGRFVVLLLGCFSSGKSTLLNALLGRPVLPVKVNPCTAILTEVIYGETPGVDVRFSDGRVEKHTIESFLEAYQLRTGSEDDAGAEAADRFGDVDRATVSWPLDLLKNGVVLLDTPGLDDDPSRTARTLSSLPDADAVIFALSATRFLSELERRTLERDLLPLGLTNLFFPTTMVDLLAHVSADPESEMARIRTSAGDVLGPLCEERLFPLNARGGMLARWDPETEKAREPEDVEALASTGMVDFEAALEQFLVNERGQAQLVHLHGTASRIQDELTKQARMDRATAETGVDELKARQAELEPRFAELDRIQRRVERTVDQFIVRTKTVVWEDLRDLMVQAERELPDAVANFDLGGLASLDLLTERGRARVEARLKSELEGWLEARIRGWQRDLEPKMQQALVDLRNELAADAQDFDDVAVGIVTDFAGGVSMFAPEVEEKDVDPVERWFSVAVGAILLSPGTVAAGWSEGYEGAMKGAAGRLGVRLAILGIGALLGPIGWAGLLLYAVSDAVLLFLTGGGQLRRLRDKLASNLSGRLVEQADGAREQIESQVAENLQPIRNALVRTAAREAGDVRGLLEQTIAQRESAVRDATARQARWDEVLQGFSRGVADLQAVVDDKP